MLLLLLLLNLSDWDINLERLDLVVEFHDLSDVAAVVRLKQLFFLKHLVWTELQSTSADSRSLGFACGWAERVYIVAIVVQVAIRPVKYFDDEFVV